MKTIAKYICCGIALAWFHGAIAYEETTGQDNAVPTPPAPRIAVKPYHDKVSRTKVEKRIEDKAVRTRKRVAEAEKDAAER